MTETDERIERVARAIYESTWIFEGKSDMPAHGWDGITDTELGNRYRQFARASDAISFRAGWDAAAELLRIALRVGDQRVQYALERLDANRPGEAP